LQKNHQEVYLGKDLSYEKLYNMLIDIFQDS